MTEPPCLLTTLEEMAQIIRDRHRTHRTDVGAAGVPRWHPYSREERGGNDAKRLTEDLPRVSSHDAVLQHQPMHVNVAQRDALAEYVRALEVVEGFGVIATPGSVEGRAGFGVDRVIEQIGHRRSGLRSKVIGAPTDAREREAMPARPVGRLVFGHR